MNILSASSLKAYTEVFGWGSDNFGQLGLGTNQKGKCYCIPRIYTFNVVVKQVACGSEHSAFITKDGFLFTVGNNQEGRLGINDKMVRMTTAPRLVEALSNSIVIQASCGQEHTAAILSNGDIYTWGLGKYGALGTGELKSQWKPMKVKFIGQRAEIKFVSCGGYHTIMIDYLGHIFVCGLNDYGQLGTNATKNEVNPIRLEGLGDKIKMVASGVSHTLALTEGGKVLATGLNDKGQLGTGIKRSSLVFVQVKKLNKEQIVKIAANNISACLTINGKVFVWGFGDNIIPVVLNETNKMVREVSVGHSFGALIDIEGNVYTWGTNKTGELGTGDYKNRYNPIVVPTLIGRKAKEVACGQSHVIILGETITSNNKEPLRHTTTHKAVERSRSVPRSSDNKPSHAKEVVNMKTNLEYLRYKNNNTSRKIQEEKKRAEILAGDCDNMKQRINKLKDQILLFRDKRHKKSASLQDNMDKNLLLKDYENRMVREIKESQAIEHEKVTIMRRLKEKIHNLENASASLQQSNTEILNRYTNELVILEERMNKCKMTLKERRDQNEPYSTSKTEPYESLMEVYKALELDVRSRENEITMQENQIQSLRAQLRNTDNEVCAVNDDYLRLDRELQQKYNEFYPELAKLKQALDDKTRDNLELQQRLSLKQSEAQLLSKEALSWSQVSENLRGENTQLKRQIEQLEMMNKKILEGMNNHMYARAAEYKERTLRALSHSPFRGKKPLNTSMSTEHGVKEIARMTRFAADTVESIKNKVEGTISPLRSKDEFNPDYVIDKEVYKIEEDPKYVKSNYQLIQILDQYGSNKEKSKVAEVKLDYVTPVKSQVNPILKSAQKLIKVIGTTEETQKVIH